MVLVPQTTADFTSRVSRSYVPFTCKFPMVMHFVPIHHRRCRSKTNFYFFSYDKTSLKFCASFRFFLAVFIEKFQKIRYLNYMRRGNITTQSVASPRTPHLSMITNLTFTFDLWPPKSIGFTMVNMSAKFDEEAHNGLVCIRFTAYFHTCSLYVLYDLDLWPPKSIGSILAPKLTSLQSLMKKYTMV